MPRWTAADLPELTGSNVVVTGANGGLGLATAVALAAHGAQVTVACRDPRRASTAADICAKTASGPAPTALRLDLADLSSIRTFVQSYSDSHDHLNVLVNNAGVMAIPRMLTADGFEMQLGINHLGHFALTGLLMPLLMTRPGSRVVTISSLLAWTGNIRFHDLQGEEAYDNWAAYSQAKLANLLFAFELDRRVRAAGGSLTSVAAHPGYAATQLQANGPAADSTRSTRLVMALARSVIAQSAAQGALPGLYAGAAPGVLGGEYFGPRGPGHVRGLPTVVRAPRSASDLPTAARLWDVSEQLTGVSFERYA